MFPEVFVEGKVDFDKPGKRRPPHPSSQGRECSNFTWAGKDDAVAALADAEPWDTSFVQKSRLILKRPAMPSASDNLEVLKLLFKPYFGRVKLIYIDPPYNTGQDFVYPDNYVGSTQHVPSS